MRCAGIPSLRFTARTRGGGGGACATVQLASAAVASGAADAVVVYRAFNERSGRRFGQPISENNKSRVVPPGWNWYLPFGLDTPAKMYSLWYQRYMHRYDVTNVDFGLYPVVARKHAATNPNACFYQRPLTLEEHQESRWIVEPILRSSTAARRATAGSRSSSPAADRARDLPQRPVRVDAAEPGATCATATRCSATTAATSPSFEDGAPRPAALRRTGLAPDDIDVAMIYENFSPARVPPARGASASAGPARPRDFIADGNIEVGGTLPVNPNGGLLGEALHPRDEQHPRRRASGAGHRGQPGRRRRARARVRGPQRSGPRSLIRPSSPVDSAPSSRPPGTTPLRLVTSPDARPPIVYMVATAIRGPLVRTGTRTPSPTSPPTARVRVILNGILITLFFWAVAAGATWVDRGSPER